MDQERLTGSQRSKYIIRVISEDKTCFMRVYKKFFSETKKPIITKELGRKTLEEARIESENILPELLNIYKNERKEKKKHKREKKSLEKKNQNQNFEENRLLEMPFKELVQLDESPTKSLFRKKIKILKDDLFLSAYKQGLSENQSQKHLSEKIGKNWQQTVEYALNGTLDNLVESQDLRKSLK